MKKLSTFLFLSALLCCSCHTVKNTGAAITTKQAYQLSITNSMAPSPEKVYTGLFAINSLNKKLIRKKIKGEEYILTVTWKQNDSYYRPYLDSGFYNTGKYPIWISTAPELLMRIKTEKSKDVNLRLQQLLGLPPTSDYKYFVEMWVKPKDLFRPCPDKEISDNKCNLCFPEDVDSANVKWINNYRINSYYDCELYKKYPWTQLGYTYDWNPENKSHVGLSEFVIGENKNVVINAIYSTEEYLAKSIGSK